MQITLSGWISLETWRVFLAFARVGTAFMMLPGYGEPGIPARIRILAALMFAVAVADVIGPVPPVPSGAWGLLFGLLPEAATGALFGLLARIMISGVATAGAVIGQNVGLTNIFAQGIGMEQSAALGTAINAALLAALFAADGHHMILRALVGSYGTVPPGAWPDVAGGGQAVLAATARSFDLATQLAMPFLLLALLFNISLALVNRILPSLPVFNLGQPALVGLGLYLLASAAGAMIERAGAALADILPAGR